LLHRQRADNGLSGNKPCDNRLLSQLQVLFSLLAQENSPDEVVGLQSFSVHQKERNSELKPHAGVFGYQREVVRTYCIKAACPE
jgi:hypothetical protein